MALSDILQKILDDAQQQADALVAEAKAQAETIHADMRREEENMLKQMHDSEEQKKAQIHEKVRTLAAQQKKAALLQAKRNILSSAFKKAKEMLGNLSTSEKEALYTEMLYRVDETDGVLHPVKGEEKNVENALRETKKPFSIGESISGKGGFLLVTPTSEIDFRFDVLVDRELSEKLETELSSLLFAA